VTLSRHNVTHVIRNPFSEQKMVYNAENGTVIYRSRMHAKTKRNFEIFSAEEFIAAITQHIPDKGFQMVRYYGWYSNRARGDRARHKAETGAPDTTDVDVIDVSEYHPPRIPSKSRPKGDRLPVFGQQRSEAKWQLARAHQEGVGS
jgi:hypothetical protein